MIETLDNLIGFLESYWQKWKGQLELPDEELPQDLPPALTRVYRKLGGMLEVGTGRNGWEFPFRTQDRLCTIEQLKWEDELVEFAWENQGNWSARCRYDADDPPVLCNAADVWSDSPQGFEQVCDSLQHFLITLSLQEALFSSRWRVKLDVAPDELKTPVNPLWLEGCYVWKEPSHWFYSTANGKILLMNEATSGLWAGSCETEDLKSLLLN